MAEAEAFDDDLLEDPRITEHRIAHAKTYFTKQTAAGGELVLLPELVTLVLSYLPPPQPLQYSIHVTLQLPNSQFPYGPYSVAWNETVEALHARLWISSELRILFYEYESYMLTIWFGTTELIPAAGTRVRAYGVVQNSALVVRFDESRKPPPPPDTRTAKQKAKDARRGRRARG